MITVVDILRGILRSLGKVQAMMCGNGQHVLHSAHAVADADAVHELAGSDREAACCYTLGEWYLVLVKCCLLQDACNYMPIGALTRKHSAVLQM